MTKRSTRKRGQAGITHCGSWTTTTPSREHGWVTRLTCVRDPGHPLPHRSRNGAEWPPREEHGMDHEESAPGAIGPVTITRDELLAILDDIRARVATGDSFEGHVEWMIPGDPGASLEDFDVRAGYRTGNLQGQGGMRVIGVMPQGPC